VNAKIKASVLNESGESTEQARWFAEEVYPHDGLLKAWLRTAFPAARQEVDDVVQESYLRLWRRHTAKPIARAKAFLFTTARHLAIDWHRRGASFSVTPLSSFETSSVLDQALHAADALTLQEKYDLLAEAVAALPNRCYEVIVLHKLKGLSQKEVATRLRLSERTVANHTRVAVQKCEDYLRRRGVTGFRD
jgi:RNA polymerase sigma factor (sigma-70 family)